MTRLLVLMLIVSTVCLGMAVHRIEAHHEHRITHLREAKHYWQDCYIHNKRCYK